MFIERLLEQEGETDRIFQTSNAYVVKGQSHGIHSLTAGPVIATCKAQAFLTGDSILIFLPIYGYISGLLHKPSKHHSYTNTQASEASTRPITTRLTDPIPRWVSSADLQLPSMFSADLLKQQQRLQLFQKDFLPFTSESKRGGDTWYLCRT